MIFNKNIQPNGWLLIYCTLNNIGKAYLTTTGFPCCFPGSILGSKFITLIASCYNLLCGALTFTSTILPSLSILKNAKIMLKQ